MGHCNEKVEVTTDGGSKFPVEVDWDNGKIVLGREILETMLSEMDTLDPLLLRRARSLFQEADKLINGERQQTYGHPKINFQRIATLWSVILGQEVKPRQVALMMAGLKLAREVQGNGSHDSRVDMVAYIALSEEV